MKTERDAARAALDQARQAHAAAMLAQLSAPSDPETQQRLKAVIQQGRSAWKGYQKAATAGLASEIEGIVPGSFLECEE